MVDSMKRISPLFIVTGCSASGKSTVAAQLGAVMKKSGFVVYDMDFIVTYNDYQQACNNWLKIAYANARCGIITILFGNVPVPFDVIICDNYGDFKINYLYLHCNNEVRTKRLLERGGVWNQTTIGYENQLATTMLIYAQNTQIPVIDTSERTSSEVVKSIKSWVFSKK